jgi:hypothetical protein
MNDVGIYEKKDVTPGNFTPWGIEPSPEQVAVEITNAHPLVAAWGTACEEYRRQATPQAAQAVIKTKQRLDTDLIQSEIAGCLDAFWDHWESRDNPQFAFIAAFQLATAFHLGAAQAAKRGKPMLRGSHLAKVRFAERGKKSKDGVLDVNLRVAFSEWLKERRGEKTATAFLRWIEKEGSAYSITMIDKETFKSGQQKRKIDTIRKRIGKLLKS